VYKIPANTLFIGKNMVYMPECHSTNALAAELAQKKSLPEGTLVITDHQTAGKGQRGNSWLSSPGMNFTFSLVLKPAFLPPANQFLLTMTISIGICDYLTRFLSGGSVKVKWPNDVMANDKKICGILIENQIQGGSIGSSIVGVGLNMNQTQFDLEKATSLKLETRQDFDLKTELEMLLSSIEARYLLLREGNFEKIKSEYLNHLYWIDEPHAFIVNGHPVDGVIEGVDDEGRLQVEVGGKLQQFNLKEIQFVR
jgi:BirA family biotin operon repressor/biotin-[acetyl-CoA-carboxylase] ligase